MKQQIAKREKEINTALQTSAEERKLAQAFNSVAAPYQALIKAEGAANPIAAFKGLMDTAATLKMGTASQKAQKISDLIGHYGVDINELDAILSGDAPKKAQNSELDALIAQRLQPMERMISQYQQREQQQIAQKNSATQTEIAKFSESHEFFEDVRMTMADAMDLATKQGRAMSLQEAYDFACNMTPDVKSVMATRNEQNSLVKKKQAASSLAHKVGGSARRETPASLEDAIAAAWDGVQS